MQWSKLKTRFRALICDELRDRLDFHLTSYRESHDGAGEIWITFDGEKIYTCGHYAFEIAESEGYHLGLAGEDLRIWLAEKEIYSPKSFGAAMKEYLDKKPLNLRILRGILCFLVFFVSIHYYDLQDKRNRITSY